jgi:hypothetical protein
MAVHAGRLRSGAPLQYGQYQINPLFDRCGLPDYDHQVSQLLFRFTKDVVKLG